MSDVELSEEIVVDDVDIDSKSINKAFIVGNLEKDPNIGQTANNKIIANLSVITDESYINNEDVKVEKYEKHRVVAWGKQAEYCKKLKKGQKVYIEGKNQSRKTENGIVGEIVATKIQ